MADESRHLHRVLVARLVAPLDALPRFGIECQTRRGDSRHDRHDRQPGREMGEVSSDCLPVSFLLEIFRFMSETPIWGSLTPNRAFFWAFWQSEGLFRTEGRLAAPFCVSVARAARWARGRQMCVPPARKERNGVPMIGRMGGGARRYGTQARSNPAPPRALSVDHVAPFPTRSHQYLVPAFSSPPHPRSGADLRDLNPLIRPGCVGKEVYLDDLTAIRNEALFAPPRFVSAWLKRNLNDARDIEIAVLLFNIAVTMWPAAVLLRLPLAHPRRCILRALQRALPPAVHPRDALQHAPQAVQARLVRGGGGSTG